MADGGGLAAPVTLTADLAARAIIAAAQSLGFDPVRCATCHPKAAERVAITAAAGGLHEGAGVDYLQLARVLGVATSTMYTARSKKGARYKAAEQAAMRAVELASIEPEFDDEDLAPEISATPEPVAVGPVLRRPPPGPIAAQVAPPAPTPARTPAQAAQGERSVRDLVLEALKAGPRNTQSLATIVDRKEMAVSSALSVLFSEDLVIFREADSGPRKFEWLLAEGGA